MAGELRRLGITDWMRGPGGLLGVCVGSYFAVRCAQIVIGPVVPVLTTDLGISAGTVGVTLTGMWMAYAMMQLPSGLLSDRFGPVQVVLSAMLVTGIAVVAIALAPTALLFGLAMLVLGAGAGAYYNPATVLLASTYDRVGGAVGTHRIGGQIAGVLAPVIAAVLAERFGWRVAVAFAGIVTLLMSVTVLLWRSATAVQVAASTARTSSLAGSVVSVLTLRHTRRTTILMTLVEFVGLSAMAFLPAFLIAHHNVSFATANLLFASFFTVSAVCQPLSGWGSDRLGRDLTLLMLGGCGVLGYLGLVIGGTRFVVPAVLLTGAAMSATPVVQSRMIDGLPVKDRGTGFGMFRTVYLLVGATGTTVVGFTADMASWGWAFGGLAMVWTIVLVITLITMLHD